MGGLYSLVRDIFDQADPADQTYTDRLEGLPSLGDAELDRKRIKFNVKLGSGAFGEVYQGSLYDQSGEKTMIAIKKLKGESKMSKDQFLNEARIMRKLDHPNIVKLYGVCRDIDPILIITEYMNKGSLETYIMKDQGEVLKIHELEKIAQQITRGMSYLEHERFVHRDLRTANVLLSQTLPEEMKVKVADFGLARLVDLAGVHHRAAGSVFPVVWTAPEARIEWIFTSKSDVYSFGCLLYEMITYGNRPDHDMNALVIQRPKPPNCSEMYFDTMKKCLASKPEKRPTFKELEAAFCR